MKGKKGESLKEILIRQWKKDKKDDKSTFLAERDRSLAVVAFLQFKVILYALFPVLKSSYS